MHSGTEETACVLATATIFPGKIIAGGLQTEWFSLHKQVVHLWWKLKMFQDIWGLNIYDWSSYVNTPVCVFNTAAFF